MYERRNTEVNKVTPAKTASSAEESKQADGASTAGASSVNTQE